MLTSDRIKAQARHLGFDLCGIAAADRYAELLFLREWIGHGYAGEMGWLARTADRRADVRAVLPGARSVIVTGTVYNTGTEPDNVDAGTAVIARYARGEDYHDVLRERLERLEAWMHAESPQSFEARAYVDGGPVQERVYAQYAGLGWVGKNTCLINPELGSLVFLSEIICTLPLEPDTQGLEQCGSCTRCLEACPTGALVEPGVLDATRCLSYLTIELRTSIPPEHRPAVGNHVFGCDICQDVCPYNQPAFVTDDVAWRTRDGLHAPRLAELWQHSDDGLRGLTRGTAMTRAKLTGLRRNIAVAIGNSGEAEAVAALAVPAGEDRPSIDDPMVQEHVAWALDRHGQLSNQEQTPAEAPVRLRHNRKLP